jgi:hypothetical protein
MIIPAYNKHSWKAYNAAAGAATTGIGATGILDLTEMPSGITPVVADSLAILKASDNTTDTVLISALNTLLKAYAQLPADQANSLFYLSGEVDYSTSASLVAVKFSDHLGATAIPAKGQLVAAFVSNTVANAGGTATVVSIAKDGTPTVKICGDHTITVADTVFTNAVGNCRMLMPVSGANSKVSTSEDIYVVGAADTSRSHAGKVFVFLLFMKTA